jgi:hypothetical protein
MTEETYSLSYTASEIERRLDKIDNMVQSINNTAPDENGNINLEITGESGPGVFYSTETPVENPGEILEINYNSIIANRNRLYESDSILCPDGSLYKVIGMPSSTVVYVEYLTSLKGNPVRGEDYWTDADKAEIKSYVDDAILGGAW